MYAVNNMEQEMAW